MHVHWYDERYLGLFIANGVTRVRQMWGMPMHLDWRRRIDAGNLLGPRFSIASPIVDGPNPFWPGSIVVGDAAAAAPTVPAIKRNGYDFVKVYCGLSRDAYFAIVRAARENGLPVAGHIPVSVSAGEAADAGQASVEHFTNVLLSSSSDEARLRPIAVERVQRGRNMTQGIRADARPGIRDYNRQVLATYDEAKAAALFARFAKHHTWQCPTLVVTRAMASLDDPSFTSDPRLKYMPRRIRDAWKPGSDGRTASKTPADYEIDRRTFRKYMEFAPAMTCGRSGQRAQRVTPAAARSSGQCDLRVEVVERPPAAAEHLAGYSSAFAVLSTRPIAAASRFHLPVSLTSWRRPAAVRL